MVTGGVDAPPPRPPPLVRQVQTTFMELNTSNMNSANSSPLTGAKLLEHVQQMNDSSKQELIAAAGYVKKNGAPDYTSFYNAYLLAKGIITTKEEGDHVHESGDIADFYIEVPLRTSMRIRVKRTKGSAITDIIDTITRDELSQCQLLADWDCVKHSWEKFIASKDEPNSFWSEDGDQ